MSDKENLRELIDDLKNQLQEAQDKLENLDKNERFKPEDGEIYYYVDNTNRILNTCFNNYFSNSNDMDRYNTYNCFKMKEEAEREANKILIRRKLEDIARRLNGDKEIDWNNYIQNKFYIDFNKKQGLSVQGGNHKEQFIACQINF